MRAKLERAGVSYADATGWVRIVSDDPMLAIISQGAAKSPTPSGNRTIARLDGRGAGRVIRALLTVDPPVGVRQLADAADVSPGTVSKVLPTLAADNTIERDDRGQVTGVVRRRLLDRWTADYQLLKSNGTARYYVAPRGLDAALAKATAFPNLALTGGRAGQAWLPDNVTPVMPVTQLVLYTTDLGVTADTLGLAATDPPSANVILLTPQDPAILDRPESRAGVPVAPLPIVLADLLSLPGRYPQQATALMDALAKADPQWRP
ncbi:MAG: hypothetical protein LBR32_06465 [Propionibacteriaceae bacterium]|nr:hypothetical protein [Propionibacteriaceae bacterium]